MAIAPLPGDRTKIEIPMPDIALEEELHANTRRTRITFRGFIDGQEMAIKCYRKPLFGLIHWLRAVHRGKRIRRAGGPVPAIVYSGWVPTLRCFGFGTSYLVGYRSLREVLNAEVSREKQMAMVERLGRTVADLHRRGIEQPDGNLTNFLVNSEGNMAMVDEDDVRVSRSHLPLKAAASNLGNIAARLPDRSMRERLLVSYKQAVSDSSVQMFQDELYWSSVVGWRTQLEAKRASRNIAPRQFD